MPRQRSMSDRLCSQCSRSFRCRADAKTRFCSDLCKGVARRGTTLVPALRATIVRLYTEDRLSVEQIAPLVSTTWSNVYHHLHHARVPMRGKPAAPRIACTCEHCGDVFMTAASEARRVKFCSRPCAVAYHKIPLMDRFWAKVNKTETCWLWTASTQNWGYGQIADGGHPVRAHRISWEHANGSIPDGLFVLHRCDTPPCVNPAHLWLGTAEDNARDMMAKGRHWSQRK